MHQSNWNQIKSNEWRSQCGRFLIINPLNKNKYHIIDELELKVLAKYDTLDSAKQFSIN